MNEERTLRKWRYQILKKFRKNIKQAVRTSEFEKINFYIEEFTKEAFAEPENQFIAFRRFATKNIIGEIVNEIVN